MASFSSSAVDGTKSTDCNVSGLTSHAQSVRVKRKRASITVATTETIAVDVTSPSRGFQGFSSPNKVDPCKDQCKCTHPYLNKWDGIYNCMHGL